MELGKMTWVFADGDLPPQGNEEPFGHEALMVVNYGDTDAELTLDLLFEDKEPKEGIKLCVPAKRVNCFRMDYPLGEEGIRFNRGSLQLFSKAACRWLRCTGGWIEEKIWLIIR